MSTRRCLRCCKLVPESAAFCRRCGLALKPEAAFVSPPAAWVVEAKPAPPVPRGGPSPAMTALVGMLVVAGGLAFLASSHSPTSPHCTIVGPLVPADEVQATTDGHGTFDAATVAEARDRLDAAARRLEDARRPHHPTMTPPAPPVAALAYALPVPPAPSPSATPGIPTRTAPSAPPSVPTAVNDAAPRINWLPTVPVRAGQLIGLRGAHLRDARRVMVVSGAAGRSLATRADASFQADGDGGLVVRVPDLGPVAREATVAVFTPNGAAVAVPRRAGDFAPTTRPEDASNVLLVRAGSVLRPGRGATVFVESGGTASSAAGGVLFVRAGGSVYREDDDCLVVRETATPQVRNLLETPVLEVPALNACYVDGALRYAGR